MKLKNVAMILLILGIESLFCARSLRAQVWDGGGANFNWTTADNWSPNGAPVNNGTASIIFAGTTRLTPVLDVNYDVASVTFASGAGAFTLIMGTNYLLVHGGITNLDDDTQTIGLDGNSDLSCFPQTWNAAAGPLVINARLVSGALTITGGFETTLNGPAILSSSPLTKNGAGVLTIGGAFRAGGGGIFINEGTVRLGAADVLINSQVVTVNGGTLDLQGFSDTIGALTLISGSVGGTGTLTGSSFGAQSGMISAPLGGTAGMTKTTAGTLTLAGANTYTGDTTVNGGTLELSGAGSFALSDTITLSGASTLDVASITGGLNFDGTSFVLAAGQTLGGDGIVVGDVGISPGSAISIGAGQNLDFFSNLRNEAGAITVQGGGLSAYNIVNNGALLITSGAITTPGVLGAGNDGTLAGGSATGNIDISGGSVSAGAVLLGSAVGGSADLFVSGDGELTTGRLVGNDVMVDGGTLTVLNQVGDPPDPVLDASMVGGYLRDGAFFVEQGTVTTPNIKLGVTSGKTGIYEQTGGTLDAGSIFVGSSAGGIGEFRWSGGTLQAQALTMSGPATLGITLAGTELGSGYTHLEVSGNAALAGTLEVTLLKGFAPLVGSSFDVLTAAFITGTFTTVNVPPLTNRVWQVDYLADRVRLTVTCGPDEDGDGVGDACDICPAAFNPSQDTTDCNSNGTPDECDIVGDSSQDCQPNGIPDECELSSGPTEQIHTILLAPPRPISNTLPPTTHIFNVPAAGAIQDVDMDIFIVHTWVSDLQIKVEHVGTEVVLFNHQCGSEDNFAGTVWDDESGGPIACVAGHVGTYRPFSPLSAFDGLDAAGLWTITVTDTVSGDTGELYEWSLYLTTGVPDNDADDDISLDECDNCPTSPNGDQADADADGLGDVCDNCPGDLDPDQTDNDEDGYGDQCDFCPGLPDGEFETFSLCLVGPDEPLPPVCGCADFDGDGDADLADFAEFQAVFAE